MLPHQMKLTDAQKMKLLKGLAVQIPHSSLGRDSGSDILHLGEQNARKLLKAYKAGKGVRLSLSEEERQHGGDLFSDIIKNPAVQRVAEKVIDKGIDRLLSGEGVKKAGLPRPMGGDLFSDVMKSPITKRVVDKVIDKGIDKLLGGKVVKGSEEAKERMRRVRAMKKGGGGVEDFFGKIGNAFTQSWNQPPRSETERQMANFVNRNIIGSVPAVVSRINPDAGEIIGLPINAYLAERSRIDNGGAVRRKRGKGVKQSVAYKKAMKNNFGGIDLEDLGKNEPVSKFTVDKRVKPSSDEQTLSPYQSVTSPAMNPFVPKTYVQEGGTHSQGRGIHSGKGLYAGGLF